MQFHFDEEVARAVEDMGQALAQAIKARDGAAARAICAEAIEWARKMRHPIARRLELALGAD